ncbi:MAG: ribonuclease HI family protein [Candidatus Omnitrophica bacterium]|nr:ribonuclease HI family protein [Candidatus Omnitrophota bacterium]MDD5080626.1 ribonuclease HI family protein [Candidatus Omnitrophota bacterium]MDD5441664.1 ribonuclease HI family protein [Candidatus Omnitrophota bacterium]
MITAYIDGASIGNPGKVGAGYVLYKDGKVLSAKGVGLGVQTNNFAEYMALIFAVTEMLRLGEKSCEVFSDSQLLCEQMNGRYKVKNNNIIPLFILASHLVKCLDNFSIRHIPREQNKEADKLSKEAAGYYLG